MTDYYVDSNNTVEIVYTVWTGAAQSLDVCNGDTSVATEDLLIDDGCDWQTVEAVSKGLPQLNVVPPFTCGREP